ncbi:NUDIX domain-containing protein [Aerophototrophica crusticola]|uniref:NUDIX domain-containing protein n=1 Tax=Aerophototrophica crusticola TaxID=1709002 RepID=A0A858R8R8_9PROT|nr:NUDIX domain-containing protein [Rhodospirillaceae bacterium B3]
MPDAIRRHIRAVAVVRQGGRVLLHRQDGDGFWSLPGGGIEPGETSAQAVARELREELGRTATVGSLLWVVENQFTYAGTGFIEVGFCYDATIPDLPTNPFRGVEPRLEFAWFDLDGLEGVDLRPAVLKEWLPLPPTTVRHLVATAD